MLKSTYILNELQPSCGAHDWSADPGLLVLIRNGLYWDNYHISQGVKILIRDEIKLIQFNEYYCVTPVYLPLTSMIIFFIYLSVPWIYLCLHRARSEWWRSVLNICWFVCCLSPCERKWIFWKFKISFQAVVYIIYRL